MGSEMCIRDRHSGNLGATGCVSWMFDRKGLFVIAADKSTEEQLMEVALEAGAEDIKSDGDFEVLCDPDLFSDVRQALEDASIECLSAQVTRIPQNTVAVDSEHAATVISLMETLDDHDDVQNVSANFDISEEAMAQLDG